MQREHIQQKFTEAGLRATLGLPRMVRDHEIFSMSIDERKGREQFVVWPGAEANRVEVLDVDRKAHQLLLFIQEPRRRFTEQRRLWPGREPDLDVHERIVGRTTSTVTIERRTPSEKRHMLCGLDERGSFVVQLPDGVSTVTRAKAALRPETARADSVRQGEWFFTPLGKNAAAALKEAISRCTAIVERKVAIRVTLAAPRASRMLGNPHVAEELIVANEDQIDVRRCVLPTGHNAGRVPPHAWRGRRNGRSSAL